MSDGTRRMIRLVTRAMAALVLVLSLAARAASVQAPQVPYGDKVSAAIFNYHRATPHIATSGLPREGGIVELKALGFKTIIDLRTGPEGTADERAAVEAAGLGYHNIEIAGAPPTEAQVRQFSALVEDEANYPVLVYCATGIRVGTMWTLYRVAEGVPLDIAIGEGRTIGMPPSRERQILQVLGR